VADVGHPGKKLSQQVYLALRFGAPPPPEYWRVALCERFGWTLEYVDNLSMADVVEVLAVLDGMEKAIKRGK
jgi:hypothetical protein